MSAVHHAGPAILHHPAIDMILSNFDIAELAFSFLAKAVTDAVGLAADEAAYRAVQGFIDSSVPVTSSGLTVTPLVDQDDVRDRLAWIKTVRGCVGKRQPGRQAPRCLRSHVCPRVSLRANLVGHECGLTHKFIHHDRDHA
jgi:hypothetical protein